MNVDLKQTFARIKPVCDIVMMCPSAESIEQFTGRVSELKKEAVQELQQYLLFPFITHIKSTEIEKKYELQWRIIDAIRVVLEKVTVISFEMCIKIETGLLSLVFDNSKPGMIAEVPEELKHSVVKCLTVLMLNIDERVRKKMLRTQVPLIAQAVFVSVHLAKLERLRSLRLAAIDCVTAHTASHRKLTTDAYHIKDIPLEALVVDMLASILPGVLAALQDVATCTENPGHAVVVAAIDATHRILCLTMNDKYLLKHTTLTAEDFAKMVIDKRKINKEVSNKENTVTERSFPAETALKFTALSWCFVKNNLEKNPKEISKRSAEWFAMAGEKLLLITKSLASLLAHEHARVRRELAVYCARLLNECHQTMQPSVPIALDMLIALCKDDSPEVSEYCSNAVATYFATVDRHRAMDSLCENFFTTLTSMPRILNNIDSGRKLSALNLLHGYISVMCDSARPQTLTAALSGERALQALATALLEAAAVHTDLVLLVRHTDTDVRTPAPRSSPWLKLRHLEGEAAARLWGCAALLGGAECGALLLDRLPALEPAGAALANALASAPNAPPELAQRVISAYTEESTWYMPFEVSGDETLAQEDTLDPSVYNPRAWTKDSVPGLYEGATETRYTGVSYATARAARPAAAGRCASLAQAQRNMALACLHAEGVGLMARRLGTHFRPYLLKTLSLILERVGSRYGMLHLAGVKAITDIAAACAHASVPDLIRCNADYLTHQISVRLKKAWNTESALQILSVVMKYSDASILDSLYGIVEDVLVQSFDKYHEKNLQAYLRVFLTFITCIRKWFPIDDQIIAQDTRKSGTDKEIDIFKDLMAYVTHNEEVEKLMKDEETGSRKSAEEMYREDQKNKEEGILDYDDKVTEEAPPVPRHITVTRTILKRCVNFLHSNNTMEGTLTLQVLNEGLPILKKHEDELLPLVHLCWEPQATSCGADDPVMLRRALELLVTMAALAKDFIRQRAATDVLPDIYVFLHKSARCSHLKDAGSAYRNSSVFRLQVTALGALCSLAEDLALEGDRLEDACACVDDYLSRKQPKPLQELAVKFFRAMLDYDYGATWYHLRKLASNECVLHPPEARAIDLVPIIGTPYAPSNKDLEGNMALVFAGHDRRG